MTSILSSVGIISCSYETTIVEINSLWKSTWDFNNPASYEFDENYVELVGGKLQLKQLDLQYSGDEFNSGSFYGTQIDASVLKLNSVSTTLSAQQILPDKASSLVAYWAMENNGQDTSGSEFTHDLADSNLTYNSDSKSGDFSADYSSSAIAIHSTADHDDFNFSSGQKFSISFWYKFTTSGENERLMGQFCHDGTDYLNSSWTISKWYTDAIVFTYSEDGTTTKNAVLSSSPLQKDIWHYFTVTYDGTTINTYQNSDLISSASSSGLFNSSLDFLIGARYTGLNCDSLTQSVNGQLDEISIWRDTLGKSEITKLFQTHNASFTELSHEWTPRWDSIIGYWKMDGNWSDSSGNGHHAAAGIGPSFNSSAPKVGAQSGLFDGDNGDVNVTSYTFPVNDPISMSTWVKRFYNGGTTNHFMQLPPASGGEVIYGMVIPDGRVGIQQGINWGVISTGTVEFDVWTHISFVRDPNGTYYLYINGQLDSIGTNKVGVDAMGGSVMRFGGSISNPTFRFNGELDDFALWNDLLTAADVETIYRRQNLKHFGYYDSEVIDLGNITATWPDLAWSTSLPFGKELVGDFNSNGIPDSESSADYSSIQESLILSQIGYWNFNELLMNTAPDLGAGNTDFLDKSGSNHHLTENGGVTVGEQGIFQTSAQFDGVDDYLILPNINPSPFWSSRNRSVSMWINPTTEMMTGYHSFLTAYVLNYTYSRMFLMLYNGQVRFQNLVYPGPTQVIISGGAVKENQWNHVVITWDDIAYYLYLDGKEIGTYNHGGVTTDATFLTTIGADIDTPTYFKGLIDEVSIWQRSVSENEVRQLYRRGVNRVNLQIKSCVDVECQCQSFNSSPVGSDLDCDGDGIANTLDFDDAYKSSFVGPGGDSTTYYSESYNRASTDITFNCALNTTDSLPGICVSDEITLTGGLKPTAPSFLNTDYTEFINPVANRYSQYRVYMEADDNTACSGAPCVPELSSVNLSSIDNAKYYGVAQLVKPISGLYFKSISAIEIEAENCVSFQLSPNDTDYYYWGGSVWLLATDSSIHTSSKVDVKAYITNYSSQMGEGSLFIKAYLTTDSTQTSPCEIGNIDISN